jgi:DMSO reductase anchor subunit
MRAWRAVLMWRTSWMSREVILLPAFIALVGAWALVLAMGLPVSWAGALPLLAILGAFALWYCTAMIYACLRFIQEWAHPLTVLNFTLTGASSGAVLACAIAAWQGQTAFLVSAAPWALAATMAAWVSRVASLRRNAGLKPKSTTQSATGLPARRLVQKSMGMSAGSFNTREFFHGASQLAVKNTKWFFLLALFVFPVLLQAGAYAYTGGVANAPAVLWLMAVLLQAPGLIAERWFFFAQAQHPQNLYYQTVS